MGRRTRTLDRVESWQGAILGRKGIRENDGEDGDGGGRRRRGSGEQGRPGSASVECIVAVQTEAIRCEYERNDPVNETLVGSKRSTGKKRAKGPRESEFELTH